MDLGWLFLLPGIVLIAAAVLIAAEDDLYEAKFRRDGALAIEARHAERVERYAAYLDAVKRRDPTVMRSLVVGQLNSEFTDLVEARLPGVPVYDSTEVFASLEPPDPALAHRERVDSVLARWATDNGSRVWLLASGALCVFVGLLPPVNRRGGTAVLEEEAQADGEDAEFENSVQDVREDEGEDEGDDGGDATAVQDADEGEESEEGDGEDDEGEPEAELEAHDSDEAGEAAEAGEDEAPGDTPTLWNQPKA